MAKLGLFFILFACVITSCKKGPQTEIPFRAYVDIPAGLSTFMTHNFVIDNIPGAPYGNILEAQPAYVRIYVEDGEPSADFIREAFFEATTDSTRQEMAFRQDIPFTNSRFLELHPSILEMKDHISQDNFQMTLKLNLRANPVTTTRLQIDFGVVATLGE